MKERPRLIDPAKLNARILAINGSPRENSHSAVLLKEAVNGALAAGARQVNIFNLWEKEIGFCNGCSDFCRANGKCQYDDDFHEFHHEWLQADGIIWSTPVYHMGPPAQVRAVLDRLNMMLRINGHNLDDVPHQAQMYYPRYLKAMGHVVQGGNRFGGQEITLQFLNLHAIRLNCIPVTGDMPHSCLGVAGQVVSHEELNNDNRLLASARSIGRRVVGMALIIKAGKSLCLQSLPSIYSYEG